MERSIRILFNIPEFFSFLFVIFLLHYYYIFSMLSTAYCEFTYALISSQTSDVP